MFEVGQKVWDVVAGEGTVTAIENENHYPVVAKFSNGSERTYSTDGKSVKSNEPPSLYPYPVEIVKKATKPSIDWEHVATVFNYLAEDSAGGAFLSEKEPFIAAASCWGVQSGETAEANVFASYKKGTCNWKDSLVARPKDV